MAIRPLDTARLCIRDVVRSDADGFWLHMQPEAYWRDLPIDPPTKDAIATRVDTCLAEQADDPRVAYFLAVTDQQSGVIVGEAILHIRSPTWHQAEIGWGVSADRTGHGLATEIGMALLWFAFTQLGMHRVYAQCRLENVASRRVMAKLGMREEGVLRENVLARGDWWSSVQSSILSTEFD